LVDPWAARFHGLQGSLNVAVRAVFDRLPYLQQPMHVDFVRTRDRPVGPVDEYVLHVNVTRKKLSPIRLADGDFVGDQLAWKVRLNDVSAAECFQSTPVDGS
jgi:hypothetical protein